MVGDVQSCFADHVGPLDLTAFLQLTTIGVEHVPDELALASGQGGAATDTTCAQVAGEIRDVLGLDDFSHSSL